MRDPTHINAIRRLNDEARSNPGVASLANVTIGFQSLPDVDRLAALSAIMRFSKFDGDNDPYGEHDFGAIYQLPNRTWTQDRPRDETMIAATVFWKVDYYDQSLTFGSDAPWNAERTKRVLTIMLASEY